MLLDVRVMGDIWSKYLASGDAHALAVTDAIVYDGALAAPNRNLVSNLELKVRVSDDCISRSSGADVSPLQVLTAPYMTNTANVRVSTVYTTENIRIVVALRPLYYTAGANMLQSPLF